MFRKADPIGRKEENEEITDEHDHGPNETEVSENGGEEELLGWTVEGGDRRGFQIFGVLFCFRTESY